MKGEFKRAIFKKSNLVLVFIIVSFMFLKHIIMVGIQL